MRSAATAWSVCEGILPDGDAWVLGGSQRLRSVQVQTWDYDESQLCDCISVRSRPCTRSVLLRHGESHFVLLLETFTVEGDFDKKNADVEARNERAIEMLYGSKEGYIKQEKTPLYQGMSKLRDEWKRAERNKENIKKKCMRMKKIGRATTRKAQLRSLMRWSKRTPSTTT